MKHALNLTIDPGECTGLAWGFGAHLLACAAAGPGDALEVPDVVNTACHVGNTFESVGAYGGHMVIELPRFYPPKTYGHPKRATAIGNALIRESVTLGRWEERAHLLGFTFEEIYPRAWKGSIKKKAMCMHVIKCMTPDERKMVSATLKASKLAKSKTHNVLDAIGMFFWKVGRL